MPRLWPMAKDFTRRLIAFGAIALAAALRRAAFCFGESLKINQERKPFTFVF